MGWLIFIFTLLAGLFLALRGDTSSLANVSPYVLALAAVIVLFAVPNLSHAYQGRLATGLRHALIWIGLFLAVVGLYAYRDDFGAVAQRVAAELGPAGQPIVVGSEQGGERAVRIRRRADGPFMARADVNGAGTTLLVDTGASTVVLKPADAERAGIDTKSLAYTVAVETANGTAYAAPVRLRSISIGPIQVTGVEALVAKPGSLKESLLGMSFLKRLRSYEFSGEFLTLRS